MVSKKGFMKTIEMIAAAIFVTIFMLYVIPQYTGQTDEKERQTVLESLKYDLEYRDFVIRRYGCYNSTNGYTLNNKVEDFLPEAYEYRVCIDDVPTDLPASDVQVETQYLSGNVSLFKPKIVRLYYWIE